MILRIRDCFELKNWNVHVDEFALGHVWRPQSRREREGVGDKGQHSPCGRTTHYCQVKAHCEHWERPRWSGRIGCWGTWTMVHPSGDRLGTESTTMPPSHLSLPLPHHGTKKLIEDCERNVVTHEFTCHVDDVSTTAATVPRKTQPTSTTTFLHTFQGAVRLE